ncbi:MAG: hypothetical protein LBK75_04230 [Oscillospiraceae bacterium]|jgi:hypothetical protein|nr:hypothetical protein [Oscillospiraceae bacterium]
MTSKKMYSKTQLWVSGLALLLCLTLFAGLTYAWFTSTVTNSGNVIKAGTVELNAKWYDVTDDGVADTTAGHDFDAPIFTEESWEPGLENAKYIEIQNLGNLKTKFRVGLNVPGYDKGETNLTEVIKFYVEEVTALDSKGTQPVPYQSLTALESDSNGNFFTAYNHFTAKGEKQYYRLAYMFCATAGNAYQELALNNVTLTIGGIQELADDDALVFVSNIDELMLALIPENKPLVSSDPLLNGKTGKDGSTIVFLNDIEMTEDEWAAYTGKYPISSDYVSIWSPHNFDLNGFALELPNGVGIVYQYDGACTIDIANGTIVTETLMFGTENAVINLTGVTVKNTGGADVDFTKDDSTVVHEK